VWRLPHMHGRRLLRQHCCLALRTRLSQEMHRVLAADEHIVSVLSCSSAGERALTATPSERTKLQNPLLRARVEGVKLDMREVALLTLHLEGMQGFAGMLCMRTRTAPLAPVHRCP
jgi:hypothetical protein